MLKKMKLALLTSVASLLTLVAFTGGVSPQSMFILYEPDVPESLKR